MNPAEPYITNWIIISALVVLSAPLLSAVLAAIIPLRYSWLVSLTAPLMLLLCVVGATMLYYHAGTEASLHFSIPWFSLGDNPVEAGLLVDKLTLIMVVVVSTVSFLIHLYSTGYMAGDTSIRRYFVMLGFFTFSMLGIVLSDNLLLLFMFWELVGFSSYMLIGHWTEQAEAGHASKKAYLMNRIGDLGFIIGLMIVYHHTGTFQLTSLMNETLPTWETAASLCFFLAIVAKSAQFPLLTWLPDAMAGPTPVSALIHAATMVAAGVFLLARIHFLFTPLSLGIVCATGLATALAGAAAALTNYDIKRILAYSTVSQLGLMITALGAGAKEGAVLHLFTHAFFKAGLFLAAGAIIHSLHQAQLGTGERFDVQDIRNLGGLRKKLPLTFVVFLTCGASLAALPLFSGFQSKESILASMMISNGYALPLKVLTVTLVLVISFITVGYTFRLIWFAFVVPDAGRPAATLSISEVPFVMRFPMVVLALASLWWIVSPNPLSFSGWFTKGAGSMPATALSLLVALGALCSFFLYFRKRPAAGPENRFGAAFAHAFYLDRMYNAVVTRPVERLSVMLSSFDRRYIDGILHGAAYAQVTLAHIIGWFDRTFIDGTVNGVARVAGSLGAFTRSFQGGKIQLYIFWAGLGIVLLTLFLIR